MDQLGIEAKFYRGDAKLQLQKEVKIIRGVQKKKVVAILDEAHLLEKDYADNKVKPTLSRIDLDIDTSKIFYRYFFYFNP